NTLDLSAVAVLRERTSLPVIVDPSHATGAATWVPALALAAVAAGADGLLVESHPVPTSSMCDAPQAITPAVLRRVADGAQLLAALTRPLPRSADATAALEATEGALRELESRRAQLVERAGRQRAMHVDLTATRRPLEVTS